MLHTHQVCARLALGAKNSSVIGLVVRQGLVLVLIGVVLGILGAVAISAVLSSLLFEVESFDPLSYGGLARLPLFVALIACYLPAHRIVRADPVMSVRY